MGMTLLQKMGWRPGEGLGKNKEGSLEPLSLEVKMDKKGLVSQDELRPRHLVPMHHQHQQYHPHHPQYQQYQQYQQQYQHHAHHRPMPGRNLSGRGKRRRVQARRGQSKQEDGEGRGSIGGAQIAWCPASVNEPIEQIEPNEPFEPFEPNEPIEPSVHWF